jgi:hypothetical protein
VSSCEESGVHGEKEKEIEERERGERDGEREIEREREIEGQPAQSAQTLLVQSARTLFRAAFERVWHL